MWQIVNLSPREQRTNGRQQIENLEWLERLLKAAALLCSHTCTLRLSQEFSVECSICAAPTAQNWQKQHMTDMSTCY